MDSVDFVEFMNDLSLSVKGMSNLTGMDPRNVRRVMSGESDVPRTVVKILEQELFIVDIYHELLRAVPRAGKIEDFLKQIEKKWGRDGQLNN